MHNMDSIEINRYNFYYSYHTQFSIETLYA